MHVGALEVAHEDPDQVGPVVDLVCGQVLEPRSCGISKMKGEVADDDPGSCTSYPRGRR